MVDGQRQASDLLEAIDVFGRSLLHLLCLGVCGRQQRRAAKQHTR